MYSSTSWKLTAPLRYCARILKPGRSAAVSPRRLLFSLLRGIGKLPLVRKSGAEILKLFPALRGRIRRVILARDVDSLVPVANSSSMSAEQSTLPPSARTILAELQIALRRTQR